MSSISSFSGTAANSNQQLTMDKLKLYLCSKCNRHYDLYFRNGIFIGRVPLILHCNHTLCEECIQNTFNKGEVTCVDCQHISKIDNNNLKLKIQDVFPVNFYVLGHIYYAKPNQSDISKLSLKPAGVSYKNRTRGTGMPGGHIFADNELSQDLLRAMYSGIASFQEKCCQPTCKKTATLRCFECSEVYCDTCCLTVHKAARGLQTHKTTSLTSDFLPELTEKCTIHSLPLEFNCNTCNTVSCCYCIVQQHTGHSYYQLSFLNDVDRPNFDELVQNGEEKLKKLLVAFKKASQELTCNNTANTASGIESDIGKYFANIHARLQCVEEELHKNISEAKNSNANALNSITSELAMNIRNLSGLLTTAKLVLNKSNSDIKLNVKVVIERLENALGLPCYLVGQHQNLDSLGFEHGNLLENLENNFCIKMESTDPFRLVSKDNVPDDFDTAIPDSIALMNLDDINELICSRPLSEPNAAALTPFSSLAQSQKSMSPGDLLATALQPKVEESNRISANVENWIQKTAAELKKATSEPTFKIEDRENIIVTHIDTPESFYVQLVRLNKYLYNLSRDIEQHVRNFAPVVKTAELNKLYVVKYAVKNAKPTWYRGRIIDIFVNPNGQEQQYLVQFIDYGNTSIVNRNMLREISTSLAKQKPFAIQCKLVNIYPVAPNWDAKTMKLMAQIITESEVIMVVMSNSEGILEVDLIAMPYGTSVRDALIFVGDAVPCLSNSSLTELTLKTSKPLPKLHKRTERFIKGQNVDVFISHVIDPFNIYVQMADFVHHIAHLSDVMANYYNNKNPRTQGIVKNDNIYVPKKDMIVAVRSTEDSKPVWYRGVVIQKYDGQGLVDIFLVDIGNSITVSYTNIRKLVERFRNLECQAILVKMVHIEPLNMQQTWDDSAKNYLSKYVLEKNKLRMLPFDPLLTPPEVLLFEHYASVDICINALLVKEGIAQASPEASLQVEWIQDEPTIKKDVPFILDLLDTIQSTKKSNQDNTSEDESDNLNIVRKPVDVLVAKNPDLIYVSFNDEESKCKLHELQLDIQNYYSKHHAKTCSWQKNDPCVVYNNLKRLYYRAVIMEKLSDNQFQVLLRDTAEELIVNVNDIYELENQFKQALEGAIRCHLGRITPAGGDPNKWSLLAIDFLQNIFQKETNTFISKNGPVDKERKSLSVEMWYSEFKPGAALEPSKIVYYSINKLLVKNGLALREREAPLVTEKNKAKTNFPQRGKTFHKSTRKDVKATTEKEPFLKIYKTRKINSKTINDNKVFKPISVPENHEISYSTDAAFLHPGIENIPSESSHVERPKSADGNEHTSVVNRTILTSLSTGSSPAHMKSVPDLLPLPENMINISDWNELIKLDESSPKKENSSSEVVTDWLQPVPFTGTNFYAYATFVDDNAHIYLHDYQYENVLKGMEEKMKAVFDALPSEPKGTIWVPGQICTVKYFVTNSWYRGKIIDVTHDHIKVFMVDYGNIEECKHDDLRFKVMYTDIPAFANKVQLYNVFPKSSEKWLTSDLDELHRNVVEQKLFVMLKGKVTKGAVNSAIVKIGDVTINEYMLQKSANLVRYMNVPHAIPDTDDVIEEDNSDDQVTSTLPIHLSPNFLPPTATYTWKPISTTLENQKVSVGVVNIISFDKFIIEFIKDANSEARSLFEAVSDDIKKRASEQPLLFDIQLGQACVAQFSEDGEWYRGQVYNIEHIKHGIVEIWFVDFGNFENVPRDCIRAIHHDWLQLPVQQYVGQIYAVELTDESNLEEVVNQMGSYCNTIKTAEVMSVEPLLVQLYEDNDELCYKDLIDKNLINYRK